MSPRLPFVTALLLGVASVQARFNQEQGNGAIDAIAALTDLGQPGQAATLAGGSIQFLLAAANPCGKLTQADQIIAALGTSDAAVAAARGLVAAEQNFNPFVVSVPSVCSDASLPASAQLRGVVPLIDPAVLGSDVENANAEVSKATPFPADGLSVAQVMVAQGFSNFTAVALDGTKADASTLDTGAASGSGSSAGSSSAAAAVSSSTAPATASVAPSSTADSGCGTVTVTTFITAASTATASVAASVTSSTTTVAAASASASAAAATDTGAGAVQDDVTGNFDGFVASTISGLDFGTCVPTMKFEAGLNGRKDTEFTFQAIDPVVNKGQQEALNPAIIMNRIHDQLTNVCGANQAAKDATAAAQTQVVATGTRDVTTAELWNTLLGFDGADTNPDQAPKAGLVGHT